MFFQKKKKGFQALRNELTHPYAKEQRFCCISDKLLTAGELYQAFTVSSNSIAGIYEIPTVHVHS